MAELPPNPYISEETPRRAYEQMVLQLIKLFDLTRTSDREMTDGYMFLALQHGAALAGDQLTGFYAAIWEAAHFINAVAGPDAEELPYVRAEPSCEHESCRVAGEAEFALIEAAFRGDGSAVQGICKAIVREARNPEAFKDSTRPHPETALYILWSGALSRFLDSAQEDPDEG